MSENSTSGGRLFASIAAAKPKVVTGVPDGMLAETILGMRDILRDVHQAVFDHNDRPGALTRLDTHESRLNRHSDALRKIGAIDDA